LNTSIINTGGNTKIFSTNNINKIEVVEKNKIESNSDIREVLPKGYLLSQINLSSVPSVITDAINQAMIDTKDATLSDALISTLRTSLQNLDDGIYKKTYIDNTITYLENLLTSKVDLETVASIADNKLATALQGFASTSSVSTLSSRVGNSETEIINVKETINTKDTARATQITEMEARVNDTFAGYSDAIDLFVDENGNIKSQKIETLTTNIGLQLQEVNQLIVDADTNWNAKSVKLITSPSGAITGYSFQDGSGLKSNFDINADNFKISNSYNTYSPFSIVGTSLYFNGKVNFSNVTGTDGVVTTSNVQTAINNNITTIDGGKIVTNQALVNNLNATGGITASKIDVDNGNGFILNSEVIGTSASPNIQGGYIKGAVLEGVALQVNDIKIRAIGYPNNYGSIFLISNNTSMSFTTLTSDTFIGRNSGIGFNRLRQCNTNQEFYIQANLSNSTTFSSINITIQVSLNGGTWTTLSSITGTVYISLPAIYTNTGSNNIQFRAIFSKVSGDSASIFCSLEVRSTNGL
jgi:hypothetical protein